MLLYLDNSFERFATTGRMRNAGDLYDAIHDGAVKRIRPKAMTVAAAFIGLVPLLWAHGSGADVMRRIAAPLIGGLAVSFLMELVIYPVIFFVAKHFTLRHGWNAVAAEAAPGIDGQPAPEVEHANHE
jgi:Cu(I)/Ag(I) efflux system membrane protein CusA/SilA